MNNLLKRVVAPLVMTLVLVAAAWAPVSACINLYAKNLLGEIVEWHNHSKVLMLLKEHDHQDNSEWEKKRATLKDEVARPDAKFETRADYASMGIYVGDVANAIEKLEALEKEKPGEGNIASNLGTAYELNGNVEKALEWIKEGIKRNPKDHEGTEWLHVKILEAKLALAKDKDWLQTHSVLGLNFGTEPKPIMPAQAATDFLGATKTIAEVETALTYQLHERLYFVKPPEPIVADLLSDLACLTANSQSLPEAKAVMEFALEYKPVHADLCAQRIDFFDKNSEIKDRSLKSYHFILPVAVLSMIVIGGLLLARRVIRIFFV